MQIKAMLIKNCK